MFDIVAIKAARYLMARNSVPPTHADPVVLATRIAFSSFALLTNYVAAEEECARLHAERDRLFQAAVTEALSAETSDDSPAVEISEAESIARVMEWMMTFDLPHGDVTKALAEHDEEASN